MQAGAVADDGERRHSFPKGDSVEPHERGARARTRRRRPTQSFWPPRQVLQPAPPPPQEHRRSRRAARRLVRLIECSAPARRRLRRTGLSHRGWCAGRRVDRTKRCFGGGLCDCSVSEVCVRLPGVFAIGLWTSREEKIGHSKSSPLRTFGLFSSTISTPVSSGSSLTPFLVHVFSPNTVYKVTNSTCQQNLETQNLYAFVHSSLCEPCAYTLFLLNNYQHLPERERMVGGTYFAARIVTKKC
jgi:hypothetical protein